jgi:manganese-dependent ADP-ribose/CDP-alcohol diphosphatase
MTNDDRTTTTTKTVSKMEHYSTVDKWRERHNLPPRPQSLLSSSFSSVVEQDHAHDDNDSPNNHNNDDDEVNRPMYTFGVVTDIQYAPIPNGHSYSGNARYYRHSIDAAYVAATHFQNEQVQCVLNLGDIIDGKCADVERWGGSSSISSSSVKEDEDEKKDEEEMPRKEEDGEEKIAAKQQPQNIVSVGHDAIDDVLEALNNYQVGKIVHTYGNHELYNLSREGLAKKLSIPFTLESTNDLVGYYDHLLDEPHYHHHRCNSNNYDAWKLRFVIIDSFDISLLDRCSNTSSKYNAAHEIMMSNNPNYQHGQENSPENLVGLQRRFVAFGGGVDIPQLLWLEQTLVNARANNEKIILCSHQPIHPGSSFPTCLIWNYNDILTIVRKYSDVIIASFSGHAHKGGYVRDADSGVHFRTFEAMLESPPPICTYAIVELFENRLDVRGMGDCVSDSYDLDHLYIKEERICDDARD